MRSRFVAKYDYDGKKCGAKWQQWWQQGNAEGWTFLFIMISKLLYILKTGNAAVSNVLLYAKACPEQSEAVASL